MTKREILTTLFAAAAFGSASAGEGRIPIWQPTTITASGHYVVTRDITAVAGTPVIEIVADLVEIDLNGFALWGPADAPVIRAAGRDIITIRGGKVLGGTYGIELTSRPGGSGDMVIEDLTVEGWSAIGVHLDGTSGYTIRRNRIGGPGAGFGILVENTFGGWKMDGTIDDNRVLNSSGIAVRQGSNVNILNNRLHDANVPFTGLGAISYENSYGGRIVGNTLEYISGMNANGIYIANTTGCHVRDNAIQSTFAHGVVVAGNGNLVLENVVTGCQGDGIRVTGSRNQIDRNLLTDNGRSGIGWGLHISIGGSFNTYGRNTARGNAGGPCGGASPTNDFCDEFSDNSSFGDNFMPSLQ